MVRFSYIPGETPWYPMDTKLDPRVGIAVILQWKNPASTGNQPQPLTPQGSPLLTMQQWQGTARHNPKTIISIYLPGFIIARCVMPFRQPDCVISVFPISKPDPIFITCNVHCRLLHPRNMVHLHKEAQQRNTNGYYYNHALLLLQHCEARRESWRCDNDTKCLSILSTNIALLVRDAKLRLLGS